MAKAQSVDKELAELLAKAMQQPGVAEVMSIYQSARETTDAAEGSMHSFQPHWHYQVTNKSS